MNFEITLRNHGYVPIRLLGKGAFGCVYLVYDYRQDFGNFIIAAKLIAPKNFNQREWETSMDLFKEGKSCPFILNYLKYYNKGLWTIIMTDYANLKTLEIIVKQPHIPLPSFALRALMKQILVGMQAFHANGIIHRDIKCDNILLHSPPGSGRVYVKISDFGFAKKEDLIHEQTYLAGTLPYMAPEIFKKPLIVTQKVDIFAIGTTFYHIITRRYPVNCGTLKEQQMITADKALQHPYFTSPEAIADISPEQQDLALQAIQDELDGDQNITKFDKDSSFIVVESVIKTFLPIEVQQNKQINKIYLELQDQQPEITYGKLNFPSVIEINDKPQQKQPESKSPLQQSSLIQQQTLYEQPEQQNEQIMTFQSQQLSKYSVSQLEQSQSQNSSFNFDLSLYSYHHQTYHYKQQIQVSLSYLATEEQLQFERDLLNPNMTLVDIKENLYQFCQLTFQQRDIIFINLFKHLNQDQQKIDKIIEVGILDQILEILNQLPIKQFFRIYAQVLDIIIDIKKNDEQMKVYVFQILNKMKKVFDNRELYDEQFIAMDTIMRICLQYAQMQQNGCPLLIRDELIKDGTVNFLVELILNEQYKFKFIQGQAAASLGMIYKATNLQEFWGPQFIKFLKYQGTSSDSIPNGALYLGLEFISQCRCLKYK